MDEHKGHMNEHAHDHRDEKRPTNSTEHHDGHHDHHRMMIAEFRRRFWIATVLSVPVLVLSPMIQQLLGYALDPPGRMYILLALSTFIYFHGGWPFLKGAVDEVRRRKPGMMTLVGVAITVAWAYSAAIVFGLQGADFFWELVTLIDIMLLGHWVEMRSVLGASRSLELLVELMPATAHRVEGDQVNDVAIDELQQGDLVLVKPGEKMPADGKVTEGESQVDESMLTGESMPVRKGRDDEVIGGSVNGNGPLRIRVSRTGKDSYLDQVIELVRSAQQSKSRTQGFADTAAKWLVFVALGAGVVAFLAWWAAGADLEYALQRMVTVMVISCPHALGLAIPLVAAISTTLAARNGLLIRDRTAFENARRITTILFDKTGTLTEGSFGVSAISPLTGDMEEADVLRLAAALETGSEHPIAAGIVKAARQRDLKPPEAKDLQAITGKGVRATVDGAPVAVVSPGYLKEKHIEVPTNAQGMTGTVVYVLKDDRPVGAIALEDRIRDSSRPAVKAFQEEGIRVIMATGDNERVALQVSETLGLDGYHAGVLPHEKVDIVKRLQSEGQYVAMTGDGVNDAPALAQADIGIAVGSGTDVAAETADIILVNSDPRDIRALIRFGRATHRKMVQNLAWATGYNVVAIPLAAGALAFANIMIGPAVGAVLMSLSTVIVAMNAGLLRMQAQGLLRSSHIPGMEGTHMEAHTLDPHDTPPHH
ncbi:MAG: cadmium-translocating P-type ATPase [Flavobacteriales bacterium]|nr:cadmium-translocating P-type ATPase [Flavobacteriales bacterium]MCB9182260.1 cadmium-translocating P-type ATPase [Flavobacteriales bacterium]